MRLGLGNVYGQLHCIRLPRVTLTGKWTMRYVYRMPEPILPRKRNPVFDALAELDSPDISELTAPSRVAKAMKVIKSVCPDVTADEIRRRASNLQLLWPNATIKSTTLAYNWGMAKNTPAQSPQAKRDTASIQRELDAIERELLSIPSIPTGQDSSPYVVSLLTKRDLLRRKLGHAA